MVEYAAMSENGKNGWNRSAGNQPTAGRGAKSGVRSAKKVLCALCLVLFAVLGICIWLFSGGDGAPKREAMKDRGLIKEVTPAAVPTNGVAATKAKRGHKDWREREIKAIEAKYGDNPPRDIKSYLYHLKNPPKKTYKPKIPYDYFRHPSERHIADMLLTEPGTEFVFKPEFGESFNQDFINAMLDKIEIEPGDSEEVRQVKEFVTNAKKEIAELVRSEGKKPSELMNEHATALYELGQYQKDLERTLLEAHRDAKQSDQDVEDMFRAANELRKKKGLPEKPIPNLSRRSAHLRKQMIRQQKKESNKTIQGEKSK